MFLLESSHRGDSNEYTQYTIFNIKKENQHNLFQICSYGIFPRDSITSLKHPVHGKRAINVRGTEVLLYFLYIIRADFKSGLDFFQNLKVRA